MSSWTYQGELVTEIPEGYLGFIYVITDIKNNKFYVGKKQFNFTRRVTKTVTLKSGVKKKKKVKTVSDSDWIDYYGSSDLVKQLVEELGKDNFKREIIHLCKTKGELSYLETWEIFKRHALISEAYYNGWVSCKIHKKTVLGKINIDSL